VTSQFTHIESAKAITGRWLLCEGVSYGGDCVWLGRKVSSFKDIGSDGEFLSLRPVRIPVLRRNWGDRHPPALSSLALFSETEYRGEWTALSGTVADFAEANVAVSPASIIIGSGVWRVCSAPHFNGRCLTLTASVWDVRGIFGFTFRSAEKVM
jgi:hypothetical protein